MIPGRGSRMRGASESLRTLRPDPGRRHPRRRSSTGLAIAAAVAVTVTAGCQVLASLADFPLDGGDSAFSDFPDSCASASPALPPAYTHGTATVTIRGATPDTLQLTLSNGQFVPSGTSVDPLCDGGGSDATYLDNAGAWMLDVYLPANGSASPSAPTAMVALGDMSSAAFGKIAESDACIASITSADASRLAGTLTCTGVQWMRLGPSSGPAPSEPPFDMTVAFTAEP